MIYFDVIYPQELEIKNTTDAPKWANYLNHLEFDEEGKLFTRLYDKRDDFDFPIVNFPYLCSNIPESPAYGVFVSQLIRYARVGSIYEDFLFRRSILETPDYFSMVVIQTLFTNLTPLCHINICCSPKTITIFH